MLGRIQPHPAKCEDGWISCAISFFCHHGAVNKLSHDIGCYLLYVFTVAGPPSLVSTWLLLLTVAKRMVKQNALKTLGTYPSTLSNLWLLDGNRILHVLAGVTGIVAESMLTVVCSSFFWLWDDKTGTFHVFISSDGKLLSCEVVLKVTTVEALIRHSPSKAYTPIWHTLW